MCEIIYGNADDDFNAIVILDEAVLDTCTKTAIEVTRSRGDYYTREQGNSSKSKTQENFRNGLFAERATSDFLIGFGFTVDKLRLTPHEYSSWESDLTANGVPVHVKSCTTDIANKYGASWIFQSGGGRGSTDREIFASDKGLVSLCETDLVNLTVIIRAFVPLKLLHDNNLFDDPRLSSKVGYKKAVYLSRLSKFL